MSAEKFLLKNKLFYLFILYTSFSLFSQSDEDLFQQIFGSAITVSEFESDLVILGEIIGSVTLLDKSGNYSIDRQDLYTLLNKFYLSDKISFLIEDEPRWISLDELNNYMVASEYDPFTLSLTLSLPPVWRRVVILDSTGGVVIQTDRQYLTPSVWGGALNLSPHISAVKRFSAETDLDLSLSGDYFIRWHDYVWEQDFFISEADYLTDEFRLVVPPETSNDFMFLGKTTTFGLGYQQKKTIWGLSIADSYFYRFQNKKRKNEEVAFFLDESATVGVYHENRLVHTYRLNPGPYTLSDFNLNSGINKINVLIITDSGKRSLEEYYVPYEDNLLEKGSLVRVFNAGMNYDRIESDEADLLFLSGAFQYGLLDNISISAGLQGSETYFMSDVGLLFLTTMGSFQWNSAAAFGNQFQNGMKNGLLYSYKTPQLKFPVLLVAALQHTTADYFSVLNRSDSESETALTYSINQLLPAQSSVSFETGVILGNGVTEDFSIASNLSLGMIPGINMQITLEMEQEETIGTSYNMLFQISTARADYGSTSLHYDARNGSSVFKSSLTKKENGNRPDLGLTISSLSPGNTLFYGGGIDASWLTPWFSQTGNIFFNMHESSADSFSINWNGNLSLVTAEGALSVSKPVLGSFALFETDAVLNEPVYIERYQDSYAAEAFRLPGVVGSLDYEVPRDLNVFTNNLEPGMSFRNDVFSVYPPYKSMYRIQLEIKSSVFCRGYLFNENEEPFVFTAGEISGPELEDPILFFTDDTGRFELFGLNPGTYTILLYDENETLFRLEVPTGVRGYFDAGRLSAGSWEVSE